MIASELVAAVVDVPPGAWAVGVSGGADSVALLALLRERADLSLCIVHLDHQTRKGASAEDAAFVERLAGEWGFDSVIRRRDEIESGMNDLPANRSARFREVRLELFRRVISEKQLQGVVLAHHADDQAETILQRLIRGAGPMGLCGMSRRATVGGLVILRPLLGVRRQSLRKLLEDRGLKWREDESNQSPDQQRNRLRRILCEKPELTETMLALGRACGSWVEWLTRQAPELGETFDVRQLDGLPVPVAELAARRWLAARSGHDHEIAPAAAARLLEMASDAAAPARQNFPGGLLVRRRGGRIFIDR